MPGKSDHEKAARENWKALNFLASRIDDFPQWVTCVAFYTAVHVVEAIFADEGHHSDDHADRNQTLKQKRFQHVWKHYRPLWNDSLIARYLEDDAGNVYPLFSQYMPPEQVKSVHVDHNLVQIVHSARRLMDDESFMKDDETVDE